jgi:hypothetical protein
VGRRGVISSFKGFLPAFPRVEEAGEGGRFAPCANNMPVPQGTGIIEEVALQIRIRIIFGSWIRIRIRVKSWIRIRVKVKI